MLFRSVSCGEHMFDYTRMQKAIAQSFEDTCTVVAEGQTGEDPVTLETTTKSVMLYVDEPCRISFHTSEVADGELSDSGSQRAKLFVSPHVDIPPGSKVTVNRRGVLMHFAFTEMPAIYPSHREYRLTKKDGYL